MPPCLLVQTTSSQPGAIAVLQLIGDSGDIMRRLTGTDDWPVGRVRLARFEAIDDGLAGRVASDVMQLMPHGGPRVVSRLARRLIELGAQPSETDDPQRIYPEAKDRYEALAAAAVARAHSPLAIELLLDQPRRWRAQPELTESDRARSQRLNRLIDPPIVVVAGPANVGKSTLSNALLGRSMSIALDLPGTTRDYTTGRIELAGLVVDWYDTPGLRPPEHGDAIEAKAIDLARRLIERADMLIAMTDHEHDWPELPRTADIHVLNKIDLYGEPCAMRHAPCAEGTAEGDAPIPSPASGGGSGWGSAERAGGWRSQPASRQAREGAIPLSALHGTGLSDLVAAVRQRLVPDADFAHPGPWLFDDGLITQR